MFEGFTLTTLQTGQGPIRLRHGGAGPPLLLLHGNPQTHLMWNRVAPALARHYNVVCPDLRGYGQSFKPPATADHAPYAKRAMAADALQVMHHFGHRRFLVVGHDRGARVAHRLAIDSPDSVERLCVLDIIPTLEHFERTDMQFALGYYHWFWLAQPHPFPETLIAAATDAWFAAHTGRDGGIADFFAPEALTDYLAAAHDPAMIRGMCEDYRAAATIDLVHDRASRAEGARIRCPLLAVWGGEGKIAAWYQALEVWRAYCDAELTGGAIEGAGHYLAEQAPEPLLQRLLPFLAAGFRSRETDKAE